eukprot:TRINITY_DN45943_c0_g1_i1.p2 TRINITY_DN45943_c0_g1~~TRINITY_DN45943_c0_g1_i1.p2  ORF type:complete len:125 (-),score=21.02 TRINITY_DN45943_c0_g1_i1:83-457(-)
MGDVLDECPICCLEFQDDEYVTPLPCDKRHYFHQHCIKNWLSKNNSCPLCGTAIPKEFRSSFLVSSLRESLRQRQNSRVVRIAVQNLIYLRLKKKKKKKKKTLKRKDTKKKKKKPQKTPLKIYK